MCDNIFNCTSLGFIYVWLCSPQASNNNNNNNNSIIIDVDLVILILAILIYVDYY